MSDVERAIAQIADIRAQLAASSRFRGYAPEAVAAVAVLAAVVTTLQSLWPARFGGDDAALVRAWGILLGGGFLVIALEAVARTVRAPGGLGSPVLVSALRVGVPGAVMGASLALAILGFAPGACWVVPGLWQMLVGMVAFGSYPLMPRAIVWPAGWFVTAGAIGLFWAGARGGLTPLLAGGPFIVGHGAIAWVLWEKGCRDHG